MTHRDECSRQKGQGDKSDSLHRRTISFGRTRYIGADVGRFLIDLVGISYWRACVDIQISDHSQCCFATDYLETHQHLFAGQSFLVGNRSSNKPPEHTMQKIQFLRSRRQGRFPVGGTQRLAGNFYALDNFGGYLCCFDAMSHVTRVLKEVNEVFCRPLLYYFPLVLAR